MAVEFVSMITKEALLLILIISGPPMFVSMLVGLIVSLFQATTQIQEQTLTFVPKIIAVFASLALLGTWLGSQLLRFASALLTNFLDFDLGLASCFELDWCLLLSIFFCCSSGLEALLSFAPASFVQKNAHKITRHTATNRVCRAAAQTLNLVLSFIQALSVALGFSRAM